MNNDLYLLLIVTQEGTKLVGEAKTLTEAVGLAMRNGDPQVKIFKQVTWKAVET